MTDRNTTGESEPEEFEAADEQSDLEGKPRRLRLINKDTVAVSYGPLPLGVEKCFRWGGQPDPQRIKDRALSRAISGRDGGVVSDEDDERKARSTMGDQAKDPRWQTALADWWEKGRQPIYTDAELRRLGDVAEGQPLPNQKGAAGEVKQPPLGGPHDQLRRDAADASPAARYPQPGYGYGHVPADAPGFQHKTIDAIQIHYSSMVPGADGRPLGHADGRGTMRERQAYLEALDAVGLTGPVVHDTESCTRVVSHFCFSRESLLRSSSRKKSQ